jgi:predicted MPP superfamily phosphohydrolase
MTDVPFPVSPPSDRRTSRDRRSFEFLLETCFRPGNWAASLSYALGLQGRLRTTTTTVESAHRPATPRPPLRIAFAADFHAGALTDQRLIIEACETLAALKPDVLLLGGDYVSVRGADVRRLAPLLADIPAPYGKFGVLGNHDLHANFGIIVSELERAGVRILANEHVELSGPFSGISVCGLDDPTHGAPRGDLALDDACATRVVLVHSPDGIQAIADRPFDLALCGHTHGGQIRLPWGHAVVVPGGPLNRQYVAGHYEFGETHLGSHTMLVSHGVGCSGLPVRAFTPPEVHLCLIT